MGDRGEDFEVAHCPYLFPRRRLAFCPWPSLEGGQQWDETAGESVLDLIPTAAKREGVAVNMFWMEGWGGGGGGRGRWGPFKGIVPVCSASPPWKGTDG